MASIGPGVGQGIGRAAKSRRGYHETTVRQRVKSEKNFGGAIEKLEKAKDRLWKVKMEADEFESDGIARIHGLDEVMASELVEFEEGTIGIALNLESNNVGVVLMGDGLMIQEGSSRKSNGKNCSDTDGQIFLSADLFNAGIRPAINVELEAFAQFADLDKATQNQLARGQRHVSCSNNPKQPL
ncbi:hypothetical protein IFM89_020916 [Coptis chinensis]|uniref:ATPase F1/V1/A1 complex alpha/beta subunit N-terminal domain-containing protein n=1 Tax=Coptis chinensis TaxID=261450 RepID=A0A835IQ09_9MAGN|nr:hypothetical protein IFM89_020916 [Coptis chinensis]